MLPILVSKSEIKFKSSYFTTGFKLILDVLENKITTAKANERVDEFYTEFGDVPSKWLDSVFKDIHGQSHISIQVDRSKAIM